MVISSISNCSTVIDLVANAIKILYTSHPKQTYIHATTT